ncbi:MAG: RNase J family beta-CASP ribonuclease [Clostridium sp.]|uniref:RNase J family beta-CASP ribonuclease n=1 Tax=Clostridium sp. TaxID=1506 RepID=UPI002911DAAA|nr:RNase J family beta-CASP ribonuclease [Clostridium sp.]MDU7338221.1 RNase J family beta-CASP ribonuclease [Clostridium sp.]
MTEKMNMNSPADAEKKQGTLYGKVVARKQPEKAAIAEDKRPAKAEKTVEKTEKTAAVKSAPKNAPKGQKKGGQGNKPQQQPRAKEAPKNAPRKVEKSVLLPEVLAQVQKQAKKQTRRRPKKENVQEKPSIKVYFLGGLNEIGKNMTLFECEGEMLIIDCGMAFPDGDMLGVDLVIPDFTFVERNIDKIRGIVLTHGHEDHIGSLPYLLKRVNLPLYGTALTLGLVGGKLKEHGLANKVKMNVVRPGDTIKLGSMACEFIHVNHSISDAVSVAIHSPAGTIVHTGDFKIDCTPTQGKMIDLGRFAQLGKEGVLALFADSTNAERPGFTMTERKVSQSFENLFLRAEKSRIIIATFASNISRVQQIINCAVKYGRKVALSGRSMLNVMGIAQELGYLDIPDGVLIDIDMIRRYPKEQIVLITTGSQGEPMSALTRMAFADHRKVEVGPGDFIIISARPIPGNEKTVGNVIDELMKRGCEVVYESMYEVHVSGHACQEELKIIQGITQPKFFIPVHGEQKHLQKHAELAQAMGLSRSNIYIGNIGDVLEINQNYMRQLPSVPAGRVLVDGLGVGDVGSIVLRDRKHLGEDGLIVVVCTIDATDGHVISGPDIVSRGFVYVRESESLMDDAKKLVYNVLDTSAQGKVHDWGMLKTRIKDDLSRMLYDKTRRSPMILPIIMEV